MINYNNKYESPKINNVSANLTIRKEASKNKRIKLTKENKKFLKLIGLLK